MNKYRMSNTPVRSVRLRRIECRMSNFRVLSLIFGILLFLCTLLCGCSVVAYFRPEKPPYDEQLSDGYHRTKLKTSSSAEVLAIIHLPECELLSQSKNVVASSGQKKKGYKTWLKMVAFGENKLVAVHKYFFIVDEKPKFFPKGLPKKLPKKLPKSLPTPPKKNLRFDCEMVLESEVLDEPYSNENARRIAILRQVLENVRNDIDEVAPDNKTLAISGMMINQVLEAILVRLDASPVLASKLSKPAGLDFDHITLGKGKVRMLIAGDIVRVKVRVGASVKKFASRQR